MAAPSGDEELLAAGSCEQRIDGAPVVRYERGPPFAQPLETFALIRERPLHPPTAVDDALDAFRALLERPGVGEEERHVHAPDLRQQRADRFRDGVAGDPVRLGRLAAG